MIAPVDMIERPTQIVISGDILYWVLIAALLTPIITVLVHDAMARRWFLAVHRHSPAATRHSSRDLHVV